MSGILKFALFKAVQLNPEAVQLLETLLKPIVFQPRDYIIDEKQSDTRMFFLTKGQVVVSKTDESGDIVVVSKADAATAPYFGESILLGKFKKSASVTAHTRCECLSLSAEDFQTFIDSYPFVVASVYRNLASQLFDRLYKANRDLLILGVELKLS